MPKFSEQEKQKIAEKLIVEGERLFTSFGLKKVTIDMLTQAANISHSAFYAFFSSKEELFLKISLEKQQEIFMQFDSLIIQNKNLSPKELSKTVLLYLIQAFFSDPFLHSVDNVIWEYLIRRIEDFNEYHIINNSFDRQAVQKMVDAGVKFNYAVDIVVLAVETLIVGLRAAITANSAPVIELLVNAIISEVIAD